MASFIRLIDGTAGIAIVENYDHDFLTVSNFVEFETWPNDSLEQKYTFRGMYFPFSPSDPIIVTIPSMHVLSVNNDVDDYLLTQYYKYVEQWYRARTEMKAPKKRRRRRPDSEEDIRSMWEQLGEMLAETSNTANTTIH